MQPSFEKIVPSDESSFRIFERRDRDFDFDWHHHPEYELTWIVRGRGRRFVGDDVAPYEGGDVVLLGPYLPHTWCSLHDGAIRWHRALGVQFGEGLLGEALSSCPEMRRIQALLGRSAQGIEFRGATRVRAARLLREMAGRKGLRRLTALLEVLETLATSDEYRSLSSASYVSPSSGRDRARIDGVCRRLAEGFVGSLSQADVAREAGMRPASFSRFFRRATGKTFVEYVNDLRVGRACRLLVETDGPVTSIAFESGFNNVSNFNRAFSRRKGMSPREFRRAFGR